MIFPTENDVLIAYLKQNLPQEWLIGKSDHTTCEEKDIFIRIETEIKPQNSRELVCLILIKSNEIVIYTPDMQTIEMQKVIQKVRNYCVALETCCLTITECYLNCDICGKAWSKFHE